MMILTRLDPTQQFLVNELIQQIIGHADKQVMRPIHANFAGGWLRQDRRIGEPFPREE
jgi:hypothetical protein